MNRDNLINKINSIVDFITNGTVIRDNRTFSGHPAFYLLHSRDEFNKKLKDAIVEKDLYDRYDLFYYTNLMFKYMLNQYDSHTKIIFIDNKYLPIKVRFVDGKPYIVDGAESIDNITGARILKINEIDIDSIIKGLEKIICYASCAYLKITLEEYLTNSNIINSLPIMNKSDHIKITTDKGEINFDLNNLPKYNDHAKKPNYNLDVEGRTAIITYSSCSDEEKMIDLINKLNTMKNIDNYIVDLRGNSGGASSINKHLIEFLNGKRIVALCDERVFSSARMCMIDLKNIGAVTIGSNPGTPISCFGNCVMQQKYDEMELMVKGSATYWYYDDNLKCHGIYKENFSEAMKQFPNLLTPVYLNVDEKIELTLTDYVKHEDSVLEYALSLLDNE